MRSSAVTFTVRDSHIVVPIGRVARRGVFEQRREVGQQQRFAFVHDDGRRGVKRLEVDEAEANAGLGDERLQTIGQVDELGGTFGRDPDSWYADKSRRARTFPSVSSRQSRRPRSAAGVQPEESMIFGRKSSAIGEHCVRCG